MKQIAITIPDNKVELFIDLMNSLSFVKKIEPIEGTDIPEWHKAIIDERMENYQKNPESFQKWEDVQKELSRKYVA